MKIVFPLFTYFTATAAFSTPPSIARCSNVLKSSSSTTADSTEVTTSSITTDVPNEAEFDIGNCFGLTLETGYKCPPGGKYFVGMESCDLSWFQNAEIKHGRVAMAATVGYFVQKTGVYFGPAINTPDAEPWYLSQSEGVTFLDISNAASPYEAVSMVPGYGWLQVLFAAGAIETLCFQYEENNGQTVPGEFGWDPFGYTRNGFETEEITRMRLREIKHGRMAMLAIAAWVANDSIPGALPFWHP